MESNRWLTIHFNDETQMEFEFPVQDFDLVTLGKLIEKSIDSNKLILEVEGVMYLFPHSSIKYIRVSPCPEIMPDITIRGVKPKEQ